MSTHMAHLNLVVGPAKAKFKLQFVTVVASC